MKAANGSMIREGSNDDKENNRNRSNKEITYKPLEIGSVSGKSSPVLKIDTKNGKEESKDKAVEIKDKKEKKSGERKQVFMSYKINCVSDISEILCTFEVDLKVFFRWNDDALIGRKKGSSVDIEEKGLYDPDIVITNEHNISEVSSVSKITDSATGAVKCSKHYKGTAFVTSMDLKLFPFDCQNLQICFKPYKLAIEDVIMVPSDLEECVMESRMSHEWDILGHCMKVFETDATTSSTGKKYSTIYVTVLTRRKAGWFAANIFVPTFLMLVVSWLTFLYEPHGARSDRNDVSMSTLLLSISNKFVVGDAMPKVDYRTCVDIYVDTCFYLQVLTMLANAIVEKYQDVEFLGPIGRYLNLIFFLLELVAAFCLHEWLVINLWNHRADIEEWVEASKKPFPTVEIEEKEEKAQRRKSLDAIEALVSSPFSSKNLTPFSISDKEWSDKKLSGKDSGKDHSIQPEETDYIENLINSNPGLRLRNNSSKFPSESLDDKVSTKSSGSFVKSKTRSRPSMDGITPIIDTSYHPSEESMYLDDKKSSQKSDQKKIVSIMKDKQSPKNHRKISCIAKVLCFTEQMSKPGAYKFWNRKGSEGSAEEPAAEKVSAMAHRKGSFIDFGASMSGVSNKLTKSKERFYTDEAKELKERRNTELIAQMAEEFKSTLTKTNFKEALAIRRTRKSRSGSFIANAWCATNDPHGDMGAYLSTDTRDVSREEEEVIMQNLAARFLQSRWRIIRAKNHLAKLRKLRAYNLLENYACRIQRTFRLRSLLWKAIHKRREMAASEKRKREESISTKNLGVKFTVST
mmetsp:Transcript_23398/g.22536  ORF Transcript_23398/g.22536 Transcript_23398/m.22536 type:complete len:803 (+) Transcript_23398:414-2822(+)|eukprot:CAMPEP_0119036826 /NCGR_PEP_ID=MMETSP1177-20130426/4806_1 /TAXON_ID=2985 /ORGANISM="Ochromonas sp, Strain CCMP1899" /LENGTH=802 /DNA_ID=CAMNT_0006997239 /DNA_START=322 /DNA_END=2730 /DNA_ORIENTATION=+